MGKKTLWKEKLKQKRDNIEKKTIWKENYIKKRINGKEIIKYKGKKQKETGLKSKEMI